jgi:cysteine desulfurase / selenocysteine lyase
VDLLQSCGIDKIGQRIKGLTDLLINDLKIKGYQIISPRGGDQWSGIVSFVSDRYNHDQLFVKLRKEHHIELAVREKRLRCSPHFYNTEGQIEKLTGVLPAHFEI